MNVNLSTRAWGIEDYGEVNLVPWANVGAEESRHEQPATIAQDTGGLAPFRLGLENFGLPGPCRYCRPRFDSGLHDWHVA